MNQKSTHSITIQRVARCCESDIDDNDLQQVLAEAQLQDFIVNCPNGIQTQLGERGVRLSGGQKQRIGIARALYRKSPLLVLDEATSALDNETEAEIVSSIKNLKGKITTIVIAHRLSTLSHCDWIVELGNGSVMSVSRNSGLDFAER